MRGLHQSTSVAGRRPTTTSWVCSASFESHHAVAVGLFLGKDIFVSPIVTNTTVANVSFPEPQTSVSASFSVSCHRSKMLQYLGEFLGPRPEVERRNPCAHPLPAHYLPGLINCLCLSRRNGVFEGIQARGCDFAAGRRQRSRGPW